MSNAYSKDYHALLSRHDSGLLQLILRYWTQQRTTQYDSITETPRKYPKESTPHEDRIHSQKLGTEATRHKKDTLGRKYVVMVRFVRPYFRIYVNA